MKNSPRDNYFVFHFHRINECTNERDASAACSEVSFHSIRELNRLDQEEAIRDVLRAYAILPVSMDIRKDLAIVYSKHQSFVVHKRQLSAEQRASWEAVFHDAHRHQIEAILPIYKTVDGLLYVESDQSYYYVTPFVESKGSILLTDLFTSLAHIHEKTKQKVIIHKDQLIEPFSTYVHTVQEKYHSLQQYITLFEQQPHMSPFELQVCTHFHVMERIIQQCITHTNSFMSICEDDKKEHIEWATSLCHSALTIDQVVQGNNLYITNWDHATYNNAMMDLVVFYEHVFKENEYPLESYVNAWIAYENECDIQEIEMHLLHVHLLNPLPYIEAVQFYVDQGRKKPIITQVTELERLFRSVSMSLLLFNEVDKQQRQSELNDF